MKYLILFFTTLLFSFEVQFNDTQNVEIFPNQKAILLQTQKPININYSPKIFTEKGIVLLNYDNADDFVRNDLYFNGKIKDINIAILNIDKVRNKIIQKLNKYYNNCTLKKITFDNYSYKKIYFSPKILKITSKIVLECR